MENVKECFLLPKQSREEHKNKDEIAWETVDIYRQKVPQLYLIFSTPISCYNNQFAFSFQGNLLKVTYYCNYKTLKEKLFLIILVVSLDYLRKQALLFGDTITRSVPKKDNKGYICFAHCGTFSKSQLFLSLPVNFDLGFALVACEKIYLKV